MVFRRRHKPIEDLQASDRLPEVEEQCVGGGLAPVVEDVVVDSTPEDLGPVETSQTS